MNLTPGRWSRLSEPAKYRAYTRATLLGVVTMVGVLAAANLREHAGVLAVMLTATVSALMAFEARPELTGRDAPRLDSWLTRIATVGFAGSWLAGLIAAHSSTGDAVAFARGGAWFVVVLAAAALLPFMTRRWELLAAIALITAVVSGAPDGRPVNVLPPALVAVFCCGTTRASLWALRIVDDLDEARRTQAELEVAEERLRFARDLHDVVGRGFSTIAVKSELASRLLHAGASDLAATEMDEIKALAVSSMEEMRSLVRGYRGIDLPGEVAGARSLLAAAGCDLVIAGRPEDVPERLHEAAAWVVREGTTNIVRHSSATTATLDLGSAGMKLTNNGVVAPVGAQSGLRGLSERLAAVGGVVTTGSADGAFTLDVRWETT
ncbi:MULTISPECIES: histidine kinase [unclassified Gordonia (in: high G+C Gram-positive bacteria)]|uniref:sensor histidine kinase n=1 Tax=unclassified Gordonia (in: high G+C Gram-positive bacteria) TaxID=2657482 RepID=UPI001F0565E2|nr:histidine kinase [Gordonia sp. PDNC005]